jgi:tetratricopeptide (TPR) repeat protein
MNRRKQSVLLLCLLIASVLPLPARQARIEPPPVSANAEACRLYALHLGAMSIQDADKAVAYAEKAVALDEKNPKLLLALADAYGISAQEANIFSKMSWAKKCRETFLRVAQENPKDLDSRFSLLGYYLQAPGIAGGGKDKAVAMAEEIGRIDPFQGRRATARILQNEGKNMEAIAELEKAMTIKDNDRPTVQWLLTLYVKNNRVADAQSLARKLEKTDPYSGHLARMVIYSTQENWAAAAAEAELALRSKPEDPIAQSNLAGLYIRLEKQEQAAAIYQQMVTKDPANKDAWYGLGRYSATTGKDLAKGLACLDRYLALSTPAELSRQASAHWRKGMVYEKVGDKAKARAEYQTALTLNPKDEGARKALAALK